MELHKYGIKIIHDTGGNAYIFDDETALTIPPVWVNVNGRAEKQQKNAEKVLKEIARFSERDAETANWVFECWEKKWREAYWEWRFNPPAPWGVQNSLERLVSDKECPLDLRWFYMPAAYIARDIWESEELRTAWFRTMVCYGGMGTGFNTPMGVWHLFKSLIYMFSLQPQGIIIGGTHTLAHALQRRLSYNGGEFLVESEVDKIVLENDKARGVQLVDGTKIGARKLVVSNVDLDQTLLRFIGEEHLPRTLIRKIKNLDYGKSLDLLWGSLALHELPKYKAEIFSPGCGSALLTQVTPKGLKYVSEDYFAESLTKGKPSRLAWQVQSDAHWDRTRAPDGKYLVLVAQLGVIALEADERAWLRVKKEYPEMLLNEWQKYAPNMTRENVIGSYFDTPLDRIRRSLSWTKMGNPAGPIDCLHQMDRCRPLPELAHYKMPIENLYLSTAVCHEAGGVTLSPGYNCYKVIAEDFGLKKPWEEKGRAY